MRMTPMFTVLVVAGFSVRLLTPSASLPQQEKMAIVREVLARLEERKQKHLCVCLGHQVPGPAANTDGWGRQKFYFSPPPFNWVKFVCFFLPFV